MAGLGIHGAIYFKLKARLAIDIVDRQMEGEAEGEQGHSKGEPLDDAALPRKQSHDHGSCSRHKGGERQYRIVQHSFVSWGF